ncbi:hypothetical protein ACFOLF_24750 [Paenibacillus sepulcri]|uniref:Uncharacterized protein n=1 Tax=Paenibacillus sepulcri TaxID=359917 RepID=A0ABS7CHG5_9BACL|nr:hypothetical protein [Paenibacillus sepulcri]
MEFIFRRIRFKFLYVGAASALMSGILLYLGYRITAFFYHAGLQYDAPYVKLFNWIINHIGAYPTALLAGSLLFLLFFYWRSGKIRSDSAELCQLYAAGGDKPAAAKEDGKMDELTEIRILPMHHAKELH